MAAYICITCVCFKIGSIVLFTIAWWKFPGRGSDRVQLYSPVASEAVSGELELTGFSLHDDSVTDGVVDAHLGLGSAALEQHSNI